MTTIFILLAVTAGFAWVLHLSEYKDMRKDLSSLLPLYKIENDLILSKQGDVTAVFELMLPEIFTLSNDQHEQLHQAWIKAIKILPRHSILHKQDYFFRDAYKADFDKDGFLSRSSEAFFNERPFLNHRCYLMLTRKMTGRKPSSSVMSNLLRKKITASGSVAPREMHEFLDVIGQFERVISDTGLVRFKRLKADAIAGDKNKAGLLESYLFLDGSNKTPNIKDIVFKPEWKIGENYMQLYTLAEAEDLPPTCSSNMHFDRYSSEHTRFSIGFASPLGLLLNCNHIYNQFIVVDDMQVTMKKLEAKRLRLQSLSAYSRENAIARDATSDFLNEAISEGRLPIKAHFNIQAWTDNPDELKDLRNAAASAITQINGQPKQETKGAAQLFWAGLPGNAADLPMNECFDSFAEQAACFLNMETNYRSSISPIGVRLGDRITGMPVHVDLSDEPMRQGVITNRNKFILGPSACRVAA
ncbi:TraG family conjugative transposon ATPase [Niabella agricola]|nr:TraG family conjugative transposon ATPase [Niabella agricola]